LPGGRTDGHPDAGNRGNRSNRASAQQCASAEGRGPDEHGQRRSSLPRPRGGSGRLPPEGHRPGGTRRCGSEGPGRRTHPGTAVHATDDRQSHFEPGPSPSAGGRDAARRTHRARDGGRRTRGRGTVESGDRGEDLYESGNREDPSQPDQHQTRYEQPCAHRHHCGPSPEVLNGIHRFFITHRRSDSSFRLKSSVMVAEYYVESENMTSSPSDRGPWTTRAKGLLSQATSIWALTVAFIAVTLVAAGPMRVWDYRLNR